MESHPLEHSYNGCQGCMHIDGIAHRYLTVVRIENDVVFARRSAKALMCLLRSSDLQ